MLNRREARPKDGSYIETVVVSPRWAIPKERVQMVGERLITWSETGKGIRLNWQAWQLAEKIGGHQRGQGSPQAVARYKHLLRGWIQTLKILQDGRPRIGQLQHLLKHVHCAGCSHHRSVSQDVWTHLHHRPCVHVKIPIGETGRRCSAYHQGIFIRLLVLNHKR